MTVMLDLKVILTALINTLLLLLLCRALHVKVKASKRFLTFQFADWQDFFDFLVKDMLISILLTHLMIFFGVDACCVLWGIIAIHIAVDIPVTVYYCRNRETRAA